MTEELSQVQPEFFPDRDPDRKETLCPPWVPPLSYPPNCPTVEVFEPEGMLILRDDYGGVVKLKKAEWELAVQNVKV